MMKEIPFEEGKVVFFKDSNFWVELLERCNRETKSIYIATYNFNFNQYEKSFYQKLANLANLGVDVQLLYAKMTHAPEDKLEIEEIFKNFVLCAELKTNHSKLFITDDFAFIGSANFSFGSNNNYESGVIFDNKEIIFEIRSYYMGVLLDKSEFTNVPECFDPFEFLPSILKNVEKLNNIERIEELKETFELLPELRYLDGLEKELENIGHPVPIKFDWWQLYMQLYEKNMFQKRFFGISRITFI